MFSRQTFEIVAVIAIQLDFMKMIMIIADVIAVLGGGIVTGLGSFEVICAFDKFFVSQRGGLVGVQVLLPEDLLFTGLVEVSALVQIFKGVTARIRRQVVILHCAFSRANDDSVASSYDFIST